MSDRSRLKPCGRFAGHLPSPPPVAIEDSEAAAPSSVSTNYSMRVPEGGCLMPSYIRTRVLPGLAGLFAIVPVTAFAQAPKAATYITDEEVKAVNATPGIDRTI